MLRLNDKCILMLHGSSDLYGASKIFFNTAILFKNSGFDVVVCLSNNGPLAIQLKNSGIVVEICKLGILRRRYFSLPGIFNRLFFFFKALFFLMHVVVRYKCGLIYSNTTAVLVGAVLSRIMRIKHIWHVHEIIKSPKILYQFLGFCLKKFSNHVIVVSEEVRIHWAKYCPDNKITTIYNGLDYSKFLDSSPSLREELKIPSNCIVIGMIGRVNNWKGQIYFLEIAKDLVKRFSNLKFVLVGDAYPGYEYLYKDIQNTIRLYNLEDQVITLGFRSDIPEILASFDIFVLPSILPDPLPTVILEAMASARPVYATNHGGAREMVQNNETGYLIPVDNSFLASELIGEGISSLDKRIKLGLKGRERVLTKFSEVNFNQNILSLLRRLS